MNNIDIITQLNKKCHLKCPFNAIKRWVSFRVIFNVEERIN